MLPDAEEDVKTQCDVLVFTMLVVLLKCTTKLAPENPSLLLEIMMLRASICAQGGLLMSMASTNSTEQN